MTKETLIIPKRIPTIRGDQDLTPIQEKELDMIQKIAKLQALVQIMIQSIPEEKAMIAIQTLMMTRRLLEEEDAEAATTDQKTTPIPTQMT